MCCIVLYEGHLLPIIRSDILICARDDDHEFAARLVLPIVV